MSRPEIAAGVDAARSGSGALLRASVCCALLQCALLLGGCAGGLLTSDAEPPETYRLHHVGLAAAAQAATPPAVG
jgi:ABC-type uncharacterized transport system auxiliary subunit